MFRYVHTNIIAKDARLLIDFYKKVLHCKSINETRDLSGEWLDRLTGSTVGELVTAEYPDNKKAVFIYAQDPEGNILELQSWSQAQKRSGSLQP